MEAEIKREIARPKAVLAAALFPGGRGIKSSKAGITHQLRPGALRRPSARLRDPAAGRTGGSSPPPPSGAPRGRHPAAGRPYREGGQLLGRHGGEQLRQQQQQRHPHPERRRQRLGHPPGDVAAPLCSLLSRFFFFFSPFSFFSPHPLKCGLGRTAEHRQFRPFSVSGGARRCSPASPPSAT